MISGNKGFKKRGVSKSHAPVQGAINFRTARNTRPKKKKGSPLSGLAVLPVAKVAALLRGEDPLIQTQPQPQPQPQPQQQENEMADMKSELTKVISAWEDKHETDDATDNTTPEVTQVETKSNASVSQTVFDYVRDNPNVSRKHIAVVLSQRGYLETTVTALVSQFIRQKLFVFGVGKGLIVTRKTYTPMYHRDTKAAKPAAAVATPQGLAAIVHQPLITRAPETWAPLAPTVSEWTVESVVDKLNIRQARAVYQELRTLLGED
jgi:hypothetical protein